MKCIPASLSPCDPYTVPGRPWWKSTVTGYFIRQDGCSVCSVEETADWDEKNPLPRPEFRVGQVWALDLYNSVRTYTILGSLSSEYDDIFYVSGPYVPPTLSRGNLAEYLAEAFLLLDPLGSKAPWAPMSQSK